MRGLFLLCEATRQLRGEAGDSQVGGAEIAVAHGSGGWLSTQGTVVLGTEAHEVRGPSVRAAERTGARSMTADWTETPKWLVPRPTPEDREFWEGARRGELRIQHCTTCGRHQHYARMLCSHCGAQTLEWVTASGNGTVYSFTVIRQNGVPPFNERLPFVVASVDLDEDGARVIAAMPSCAPDDARVGMRVRADVPRRERRARLRRLRAAATLTEALGVRRCPVGSRRDRARA